MAKKTCPMCGAKFDPNDDINLSLHLIKCATDVIQNQYNSNSLNNSGLSPLKASQISQSQNDLLASSASQLDSQTDLADSQNGTQKTPPRSRRRKQTDTDNNNDNDSKKTKTLDDSTDNAGEDSTIQKKMTVEEYDNFLKTTKQGRLVRTGPWKGMSSPTPHQCTDPDCSRTWKPSPAQCLPDDVKYYCPSCVLHHRNNVDRFKEDRLKWTADVPNTFYIFSIVDPATTETLIKFGRTQHQDAWKRYPAKERKDYIMKLVLSYRGRLETMTIIENWWKKEAEEKDLFCRFSDKQFHGATECVKLDDKTFEAMLNQTKVLALADKATVTQAQ